MRNWITAVLLFTSCSAFAQDFAPPVITDDPATSAKALPPSQVALAGIAAKARVLCTYMEDCMKKRPGKSAYCVKTGLKESGMIDHVLEGDQAKDLSRFLRKDGFIDREQGLHDFRQVPEGAILVLDAHDPVKDRKPACPKVYGNVVVKCGSNWIDDQKYDLDFHMKRGCRTKGLWMHPDMALTDPPGRTMKRKRLITDGPNDAPAQQEPPPED